MLQCARVNKREREREDDVDDNSIGKKKGKTGKIPAPEYGFASLLPNFEGGLRR